MWGAESCNTFSHTNLYLIIKVLTKYKILIQKFTKKKNQSDDTRRFSKLVDVKEGVKFTWFLKENFEIPLFFIFF